jgi:hypothetical protein
MVMAVDPYQHINRYAEIACRLEMVGTRLHLPGGSCVPAGGGESSGRVGVTPVKEAGSSANEKQAKSATDFIVAKFIEAARHYGRLPSAMELRIYRKAQTDFPNEKTIHTHFGS